MPGCGWLYSVDSRVSPAVSPAAMVASHSSTLPTITVHSGCWSGIHRPRSALAAVAHNATAGGDGVKGQFVAPAQRVVGGHRGQPLFVAQQDVLQRGGSGG